MHSLTDGVFANSDSLLIVLVCYAVGLAAICAGALQTGESRAKRADQTRKKSCDH